MSQLQTDYLNQASCSYCRKDQPCLLNHFLSTLPQILILQVEMVPETTEKVVINTEMYLDDVKLIDSSLPTIRS